MNMLKTKNDSFNGKNVVISGSGNVAQYAAEKAIELGAKVLTLSDSGGYVLDKDGINEEKLAWVMDLKNNRRGRISEYVEQYPNATYHHNPFNQYYNTPVIPQWNNNQNKCNYYIMCFVFLSSIKIRYFGKLLFANLLFLFSLSFHFLNSK